MAGGAALHGWGGCKVLLFNNWGLFRLLVQGEFIYKTIDYFIEGSICA
jgi:hypothetical protein